MGTVQNVLGVIDIRVMYTRTVRNVKSAVDAKDMENRIVHGTPLQC